MTPDGRVVWTGDSAGTGGRDAGANDNVDLRPRRSATSWSCPPAVASTSSPSSGADCSIRLSHRPAASSCEPSGPSPAAIVTSTPDPARAISRRSVPDSCEARAAGEGATGVAGTVSVAGVAGAATTAAV